MKVLILGSGGREHALAWKLRQSPQVSSLFCAPGNAGIQQVAQCVPLKIQDIPALIAFALKEQIDLTVVGPDDALAAGIVDQFEAAGLRIFGPSQAAAQLESSKVFAKDFMLRHGIPTARSASFSDSAQAASFIQSMSLPIVVKADGLALGKGVLIAQTHQEALEAIRQIMDERRFGDAGKAVVIEEFLEGPECSIHALVDGQSYLLFPGAQDHKRALDLDQGPNTGGMGTFTPTPQLTPELQRRVRSEILDRFLSGIRQDGIAYRGMLFPGLILTKEGPKVLEFNCRFGDPETQVLLHQLDSDLLELLLATLNGTLHHVQPAWKKGASVCVILASGGYPDHYETGKPILGLDSLPEGAVAFHAGTRHGEEGVVTAGGRVLGITAGGEDLAAARQLAYAAVERVQFEKAHFRKDIALKAL